MYVQPILLTMPTSVAGATAAWRAKAPRATSATGACGATPGCEPSEAADRSSSAGPVDTVEISQEAEAALAAQLSESEQQAVQELKAVDREVRAHEQAHLAAAGPYAQGGPTYEYTEGPDGRRYATGGEVRIDTSPVPNDPKASLRKAQVIRAAAMAPSEPSGQDRRVASAAAAMEAEARRELQQQQRVEQDETPGEQADETLLGSFLDMIA